MLGWQLTLYIFQDDRVHIYLWISLFDSQNHV